MQRGLPVSCMQLLKLELSYSWLHNMVLMTFASARTMWGPEQAALERGLLPDDETLKQLLLDPELPVSGRDLGSLRWPEEPLRFVLIRAHLSLYWPYQREPHA